jgi:hypothetical protein
LAFACPAALVGIDALLAVAVGTVAVDVATAADWRRSSAWISLASLLLDERPAMTPAAAATGMIAIASARTRPRERAPPRDALGDVAASLEVRDRAVAWLR